VLEVGANALKAAAKGSAVCPELYRRAAELCKGQRRAYQAERLRREVHKVASWLPLLEATSPSDDLQAVALQAAALATGDDKLAPQRQRWLEVAERYGPPLAAAGG